MLLPLTLDPHDLTPTFTTLTSFLNGSASFLPLPTHTATATQLTHLMRAEEPIEPGHLIACTSGSTGTPKGAVLNHHNITASIQATHTFLTTPPGPWLLALPPHHIAGLQVIFRSLHAGYTPLVASHLIQGTSFNAQSFTHDTHYLRALYPHKNLYTSLVPAQLHRIATTPQGINALGEYSAVLLGGAAAPPELLSRIPHATIITTYGSSETSGGCVYNGQPLPGVSLSLSEGSHGRISITGPMIAQEYRDGSKVASEKNTYITSDIGEIRAGTLHILGRADGAINSGGYKILPEDVERAFAAEGELCAVGLPHAELGQQLAIAIEKPGHSITDISSRIRTQYAHKLPRYLLPLRAWEIPELPRTDLGKINRPKVRAILSHAML